MDPLSDILRSARIAGSVTFRAHGYAPWGVHAPPPAELLRTMRPDLTHHRMIMFHVVTGGRCVVRSSAQAHELAAGDVVVVLQTAGHALADSPGTPTVPAASLLPELVLGEAPPIVKVGDGRELTASLTCGNFVFDELGFNPLLGALPPMLVVHRGEGPPAPWLKASLEYVVSEAEEHRPGSASAVARLTELLFVEVVRAHLARLPDDERSWLAALRDPITRRALDLLHAKPGDQWTVETLAKRSGASRSLLAARFSEMVGEPPAKYLTRLRVRRAAERLREGDESIATIAALMGYQSEPAFNRAFKRVMGETPGAWRRARASERAGVGRKSA